jgi:hypothetical protein
MTSGTYGVRSVRDGVAANERCRGAQSGGHFGQGCSVRALISPLSD